MDSKIIIIGIVVLLIAAGAVFYLIPSLAPKTHVLGELHYHSDFLVYLNGEVYNFSQAKYMSYPNGTERSPFIHLHDMDGSVIHLHMGGITLGEFFKSLNMTFNSSCFVLDNGTAFCDSGSDTLKMFVQHVSEDNTTNTTNYGPWGQNNAMGDYQFSDLDRILITYGNENDSALQQQMNSVGQRACLYSLNCPWNGKLDVNESSCVGGNGTSCDSGT